MSGESELLRPGRGSRTSCANLTNDPAHAAVKVDAADASSASSGTTGRRRARSPVGSVSPSALVTTRRAPRTRRRTRIQGTHARRMAVAPLARPTVVDYRSQSSREPPSSKPRPLRSSSATTSRSPIRGPATCACASTHCGICHSDLSIVDGVFPSPDADRPRPRGCGRRRRRRRRASTGSSPGDHVVLTPIAPCGALLLVRARRAGRVRERVA